MFSAALVVCFMSVAAKNPSPSAPTPAPTAKGNEVIVESSSGATLKEPDPMVISQDGSTSMAPTHEPAPVLCFRHAMRVFGGDRKQALTLCKGGTGNMERVKCAEMLTRFLAGAYDDVARACTDGGTEKTAECVIESARLLQGSWANAISLCSHGGTMDNYQCAKHGMISLGGFGDEVVELCHNIRMNYATQK